MNPALWVGLEMPGCSRLWFPCLRGSAQLTNKVEALARFDLYVAGGCSVLALVTGGEKRDMAGHDAGVMLA